MQKPSDTPRATVLVIDDNEGNRSFAKSALEDDGYRVVVANGGAEGIQAFESERPGCILLDVRMSGLDGFAVCKRIRALPFGGDVPILFLTALRDVDTFDRAIAAGVDDFLTKPVQPAELIVRVQTALKLQRMSAELREHHELLKHQRDALLRLQLQRERLMTFVVHDLKNPLNSLDLHAQALLRGSGLTDDDRDSVMSIRAAARELNRMILNLLDVSKSDEGKLSPERAEVDLGSLVGEILDELELNAQRSKVFLHRSLSADHGRVDRELFRRTLTNLVENAIRYAPPDSAVTVTSTRVPAGLEVRVADRGIGIPEGMRERVFDPFVQVEAGESPIARGGRGLGLTFCKLAVEAHGGRIWIEDGAPGAVFCMGLPSDAL